MSEMTWVAKANGAGWTSNRTRDVVDLAFTVHKEHGDYYSEVFVRCTWYNSEDARARRVIGRFYFTDHKAAKAVIEDYIKDVNSKHTSKEAGREEFLTKMLSISLNEGAPGKKSLLYPYYIINGSYINKTSVPSATTSATVTTEDAIEEDLIMEAFLAPTMSNAEMQQAVEAEVKQRLAAMPSIMMETIKEVSEAVDKAMETPKIIVINGKEIPISWPS